MGGTLLEDLEGIIMATQLSEMDSAVQTVVAAVHLVILVMLQDIQTTMVVKAAEAAATIYLGSHHQHTLHLEAYGQDLRQGETMQHLAEAIQTLPLGFLVLEGIRRHMYIHTLQLN